MSTESTPTPVVDLLTQILNVDLSTPRDLNFQPVPEGYITLGTLSTHARKAVCLAFDFNEESLALQKRLIAEDDAHERLHKNATAAISKEICDAYTQTMSPLIMRYEELKFLKRAIRVILTTMLTHELPKMAECVPTSINYSEGFVVSMLPMPSPAEMFKDILACLSELEVLMTQDPEEEPQEDKEPAVEGSAENSAAVSEETATDQPTMSEK